MTSGRAVTLVRLLAVTCVVAVAGCQTTPGITGGPSSAGAIAGAPTDGTQTPEAPASAGLETNVPPAIDPTLLDYLPDKVRDVPVSEAVEEATTALADPTVSRIATALDVGLALDESTGNLVTAHVVRVREGAFDDTIFRQWRDTFDDGACAAAGGIQGRAETTIAASTVYVTSCVGPQRTYHVWIEDEDVLISASAVGAGGFGELLMAGLRLP